MAETRTDAADRDAAPADAPRKAWSSPTIITGSIKDTEKYSHSYETRAGFGPPFGPS